ncbi:ABC transporter ATP-binding protein [Microbacterium sp. zg-YB36]|uniref:ABC transporter ATP-binding protein n=1 Tax=Microbacterium sp. zg-YB36 TaxID=2969407 RepID=UPI00214ABAFE|nr:ABC transporter ATP-binding protein [Microbacterium sp. zg-YB36]MDL5350584.1 ATP-binding cassette domain-containing protein [Microbacterium sp. zg-YB36]
MTASLPLPHDSDSDDAPEQFIVAQPRPRTATAPRKPRPRKAKQGASDAAQAAVLTPPPLPPVPAELAAVQRALPVKPAESAAEVAARLAQPVAAPEPPVVAEPEPAPEPLVEEWQPETDAESLETDAEVLAELGIAPQTAEDATALIEPETVVDTATDLQTVPRGPRTLDDIAEPDAEAIADAAADAAAVAAVVSGLDDEPLAVSETALPALRLRGVSKIFSGTPAVDGIDLTVPAGSFYGLVGPNGAGKTTTLSMIAGLLRPDRGSIQVNGVDTAADSAAAKRLMGVLPDRLRTFDRLTGRQLLHYYGLLRGLPAAVTDSRAADLARAFDLTDALSRPVSDYSGGMTKKIMLAGAMIHSPRVLVLDEPFEAVDPVSSAVILDILGAYVAHGGTVILSSHGLDLVERVCSRVAVMVAGQVLAEGTVDEVRGELTLEQRFVELTGGLSDVEGLEWLHTFSG